MKKVKSKAKNRVVNSEGICKGYIISKSCSEDKEELMFMNTYTVLDNIGSISNLKLKGNYKIKETDMLTDVSLCDINKYRYDQLVKKNPLVRDIQEELLEWKNDRYAISNSVLQLQGAKNIGKTTELLKFAYSNYENVVYVNAASDEFTFESICKALDNIDFMYHYCDKSNQIFTNDRNTILIIDEIEHRVKVYNQIRPLGNELKCDMAVIVSYEGYISGKKGFFLPAGNIEYKRMYNLSFREFCRAYDMEELLMNISLSVESDKQDYENLYEKYNIYRKIGGYPQVIMEYMNTGSIENCMNLLSDIMDGFQADSVSHFSDGANVPGLKDICKTVMNKMCSDMKGALYNDLVFDSENMQYMSEKEVSKVLSWLESSGILGRCRLYDGEFLEVVNAYRLYFMDCGIAYYISCMLDGIAQGSKEDILSKNFVYCEFVKMYDKKYVSSKVIGTEPAYMVCNNFSFDFIISSIAKNRYCINVHDNSADIVIDKDTSDSSIISEKIADCTDIPIFAAGARFPYDKEEKTDRK